jgi:hypothetical protein
MLMSHNSGISYRYLRSHYAFSRNSGIEYRYYDLSQGLRLENWMRNKALVKEEGCHLPYCVC